MGALGVVEVIGANTAFAVEAPRPALPGAKATLSESRAKKSNRASKNPDALWERVTANLALAVENSRARVVTHRSSTTLASLAHALEASGDGDEAAIIASEALSLCSIEAVEQMADPVSARVALEILFRANRIEEALSYARRLPLEEHARLMVGACLAGEGRFEEAHQFVDTSKVPERFAVMGFLSLQEGKYDAAARHLRSALRYLPTDADSAHNLSIALYSLGSTKKAISVALQATRSAPGRQDISLHYLELLLSEGGFERASREIEALFASGIDAPARLLVTHARARLGLGDFPRAERLLELAASEARLEGDQAIVAEVLSNLSRLRASHHKIDREEAIAKLLQLHEDYPTSEVVVVNLAQVTETARHAAALSRAYEDVKDRTSEARRSFIEYQIATLEGDNETAAARSLEWFQREPDSPQAISAALVALGIGAERWDDAAEIALKVLSSTPRDRAQTNNAAYVIAMAGMPDRAIKVLEPLSQDDFVLQATLGLSYLAAGNLDRGMKLYREAALAAEKRQDDSQSLMTTYQALVVRQLGLLDTKDAVVISALSLPYIGLPENWRDQPEFLRLFAVATKRGFGWPLAL